MLLYVFPATLYLQLPAVWYSSTVRQGVPKRILKAVCIRRFESCPKRVRWKRIYRQSRSQVGQVVLDSRKRQQVLFYQTLNHRAWAAKSVSDRGGCPCHGISALPGIGYRIGKRGRTSPDVDDSPAGWFTVWASCHGSHPECSGRRYSGRMRFPLQ